MKLSKGDFAAALTDEGLTNSTVKNANASVLVRIVFAGVIYQHAQGVIYTATAGKTGSAKVPK